MNMEPRLDIIGGALADPSRSRILCELMDGRAFTNKELACAAHVSPQTASGHLRQLEAAGLTSSLRSGRHVYHRIRNVGVAQVLENMSILSPVDHLSRGARHATSPQISRSCYNHIAGRLGVLMTERLVFLNALVLNEETVVLGPKHEAFARDLGIAEVKPASGKPAVKLCLDWTERRHHISGPFSTLLMQKCLAEKWLVRQSGNRSLNITQDGWNALHRHFDIDKEDLGL
jgi:DNA-binding transcriptional ArsR family regulator